MLKGWLSDARLFKCGQADMCIVPFIVFLIFAMFSSLIFFCLLCTVYRTKC